MQEFMTIGFVAKQARKDDGEEFISIKGQMAREGQLLDSEVVVNNDSALYTLLTKLAAKYEAEFGKAKPEYPRGFAIFFPNGVAIDPSQDRWYDAEDGTRKQGSWSLKPIRGEAPAIELGKAPALVGRIRDDAAELLAKMGL